MSTMTDVTSAPALPAADAAPSASAEGDLPPRMSGITGRAAATRHLLTRGSSGLGQPTAGQLLVLVRTGAASTRSDLRRLTGLSRTAVSSRLEQLLEARLVRTMGELESTGGRPPSGLEFNRDAGVVLAVAIGRSRCQIAVCDLDGRELEQRSDDHPVGSGPDEVMGHVAAVLADYARDREVLGIGLSLPGTVDPELGASLDSPVMNGWDGVALAPYLSGVTEAPLFVGNDADVLARAERIANPGMLTDALVIKASTGLGMGILAKGRIVTGQLGAAGEIGHTKVDIAAGRACRCGDHGCLEAVAAGWALVARLAESGREVGHVRELVALALAGEPEARALLRESGRRLGEVVAIAINLLNPQAVVLGGDMAGAFDLYAAGLRESIYARSTALATRSLQIVPAAYGDRAGLVGCAALALDRVLHPAAVDARLAARAG